jgi:CBS domain containing-hemolysin-like protein
VEVPGFVLTVIEMDGRRVAHVRVEHRPADAAPEVAQAPES